MSAIDRPAVRLDVARRVLVVEPHLAVEEARRLRIAAIVAGCVGVVAGLLAGGMLGSLAAGPAHELAERCARELPMCQVERDLVGRAWSECEESVRWRLDVVGEVLAGGPPLPMARDVVEDDDAAALTALGVRIDEEPAVVVTDLATGRGSRW